MPRFDNLFVMATVLTWKPFGQKSDCFFVVQIETILFNFLLHEPLGMSNAAPS